MENKVIMELDYAANLVYNFKSISKVIVLVNGVFDIIHPGHISFLEQARAHGDILIVGVQSDEAVMQFVNPKGVINPLANRMKVVAAMSASSYVVPYSEQFASSLIGVLKPTIYIKAGEYKPGQIPEESVITQIGGTIQTVKYDSSFNSKDIIQKTLQLYAQPTQEPSSD